MRILPFTCFWSCFLCALYAQEPYDQKDLPIGGDMTLALDSFRSLPDGSWGGNMGAYLGLNLAVVIPKQNLGFGAQIGGSYGLYDFDGRGSTNTKSLQQEAFITFGLFRKTPALTGWSSGLVYDFQANAFSGVFGLSPSMGQMRGQIGYLFRGGNELGVFGTYNIGTSRHTLGSLHVEFRAISQANLFWSHLFAKGGMMTFWAGTPYRKGLMYPSGRAGTFIAGASFQAPLTSHLSVVGHGVYMGARSGSGFVESKNYAANVSLGLSYAFGGKKAGTRPYLPLGDNSNFLVDTNVNY